MKLNSYLACFTSLRKIKMVTFRKMENLNNTSGRFSWQFESVWLCWSQPYGFEPVPVGYPLAVGSILLCTQNTNIQKANLLNAIKYCVPQGEVLEPLSFLSYDNHLPLEFRSGKLVQQMVCLAASAYHFVQN